MDSEKIQVTTAQKDWDDFFAGGYDFKDALSPVDSYAERVRLACEFGRSQIHEADQRLDEFKEEEIFPTAQYEFDR